MQSKNTIAVEHAIAGMRGICKLCVLFGTQMLDVRWKYDTLPPRCKHRDCEITPLSLLLIMCANFSKFSTKD